MKKQPIKTEEEMLDKYWSKPGKLKKNVIQAIHAYHNQFQSESPIKEIELLTDDELENYMWKFVGDHNGCGRSFLILQCMKWVRNWFKTNLGGEK